MTEKNKQSATDAENQKSPERPPTARRPEEDENAEATVDQDPGERQRRNQGWEKEDPLAS